MTPYELHILLDVYCGMAIRAPQDAPIFAETVEALCARGFMRAYEENEIRPAGHQFEATEKLRVFMKHILATPDPVWRMP